MSKKIESADKFKMESFDDLFGISSESISEPETREQVKEIPLEDLHEFKNHPFYVKNDEKMQELAESIKSYGVLTPGIARPRKEGGYEIIAGHSRKQGSILAGKNSMPVFVRNYTDDEATIIMVDTNIQREDILPSEKAFAYKMKLEALKHQGKKTVEADGISTADKVGEKAGDSGRTVQRYIRLTELLPELLELVDKGKLKMTSGVTLSYLTKVEQRWLLECINDKWKNINGTIADTLKQYSEEHRLTRESLEMVMYGEKEKPEKLNISESKIRKFFPEDYSREQMEQVIYKLLEEWKNRI